MVRTLSSSLAAAVGALTRVPAIAITIEDHLQHFPTYQTPGDADTWHDACVANDDSIVRVQLTRGTNHFQQNFQFQRITDPTQAGQWSTWTTLPGSSATMFQDGGCCVSNHSGTLRAFAQRGTSGTNLWVWSSTNNGASWTGPVSVLTPPGAALTKGIGSAGNNDVFFIYDVSGGDNLGCSFFSGGTWGALNASTFAPFQNVGSPTGIAVWWDGSQYWLFYSDGNTIASANFTTPNNWLANQAVAPATTTSIARISPRICFDSATNLFNLVCLEIDIGTLTGSVYQYPRVRQSADLQHWSQGRIFHDLNVQFGATMVSAANALFLITMPTVFRSPNFSTTNASQFSDVSANTLSYTRVERVNKPAELHLTLDNNSGVLSALIGTASSYQPIGPNCTIKLKEGYKTGNPPTTTETVATGTYRINKIIVQRSPDENQITLVAFDQSRDLDQVNRFQMTYTNQLLSFMIRDVCARAGIFNVSLPATAQMSNSIGTFILQSNRPYRVALDELCNTFSLMYFMDQSETLVFKELNSGDPGVWSYQPEIELLSFGVNDLRSNHVIVTGRPPAGSVVNALTTGEAFDDSNAHFVGMERLLHHIDIKLPTPALCATKAAFILQQEQRTQMQHQITVPLNPALQLLDVVTITDSSPPVGAGVSGTARIVQSQAAYNVQHVSYEQRLDLEGV